MAPPPKILTIPPPRPPEPGDARPGTSATLNGSLAVVSPVDLLEWLCSNRRTWGLRLLCQGIEGEVVVVDGELVHARWGQLRGLEALSEAVACPRGNFHLVPVPQPIERNLHGKWQGLLLNAVQLVDQRNLETRPTTVEVTAQRNLATPGTARPSASAEELIDRGFLALRAGNIEEVRRCWLAALALQPDNRRVQFNLRKLETTPRIGDRRR